MNTSTFLTVLRANPALPLVFQADRDVVSPDYHLTEVKRVSYETMDCGSMTHRWSESQFEIWNAPLEKLVPGRGHMPAEKFLNIIDRVGAEIALEGDAVARIHVGFRNQPATLYEIRNVTARDGKLWVELSPDRTRCKAAERRVDSVTACCGVGEEPEKEEAGASCGCGTAKTDAPVCCG